MKKFAIIPTIQAGGVLKTVLQPNITVYDKHDRFSEILCYLQPNTYTRCLETYKSPESPLYWAKVEAGWIISADGGEVPYIETVTKIAEAERFWQLEQEKQDGMASAIASMYIRSFSLPKAKRLARSILKHANEYYPHTPLVKVTTKSMEDIMIILDGKHGLTKQQVFEYIKAAASRQSNPRQAVLDITNKMWEFIQYRPSTWVTEDLNIIITEDVRIRNNRFVMSAAEGDMNTFLDFVKKQKISLLSLHSELHYTALHAAADFGQPEVIKVLIESGLSLDIKDPLRGQTALHFAAYSGRAEVADLLIKAGANRHIKCNEGLLPYEIANKQGHIETREIMKYIPPPVEKLEVCLVCHLYVFCLIFVTLLSFPFSFVGFSLVFFDFLSPFSYLSHVFLSFLLLN